MKCNKLSFLIPAIVLLGCSSGGISNPNTTPYSQSTFVTMPIFDQVCASGQFFTPSSMVINTKYGSSSYCSPYILKETGESTVSDSVIRDIVHYYYGPSATLDGTCPAIAEQSGVPIPESSPYAQDVKSVASTALTCVEGVLSGSAIQRPMLVFDIDDTVTSGYEANCQYRFGAYTAQASDFWESAKVYNAFTRVPYMNELLGYAFNNGIEVAFVTGRPISQYAITESNLSAAYPEYTSQIHNIFASGMTRFVTPDEESWTIDVYKNKARQSFINQGYTIILNMGDQYSDLNYTYQYGNQPYCSYKLPNYQYYIN